MRRYGAGERLARAIRAGLEPSGVTVRTDSVTSRSWTSITFAGERHKLHLTVEGAQAGEAVNAWLAGLDEREITLPGHLVVDVGIASDERGGDKHRVSLCLDAITVESD